MAKKRIINKNIESIYPLTPLQEGMLYHNLVEKKSTSYVIQSVFSVCLGLKNEAIESALDLLSKRYSILRTSFFHEKMEKPRQVVLKERKIEYKCIDLSNHNYDEKEACLAELVDQDLNRNFDLQRDSLLRVTRIIYDENYSKFIWTMHHIIIDGWCSGILNEKFFEYCRQLDGGVSKSKIESEIEREKLENSEFKDYVHWLSKQDQEKAKEYWSELLDDYDSDCEITPMNKPKESSDEQMRRQTLAVDQKVTSTLQRFAEQNGSTINTVAEVICGIMLQVGTGNQDVVFGKVVSGRNADIKGIEDMIGLFINTIPVRVRTEDKMTIKELLKKQQEQGIESTGYDYYSLAEIQSETLQGTELIKVLYVFENYMSGLESEQQENDKEQMMVALERAREQTHYPISIAGYEMDETLCFDIMYNPNQFSDEEIQRLLGRLVKISEEIAENPDRRVAEIETVTGDEKEKILHDFNATKTAYPREKTVVELFEEQAVKTPDQIALVFEGEEVSYRELNERANVLAHKLRELGVRPDDFVAIMAERSIEMIAGIYGIIKAGAAYVPIDPTYPEERIEFMLEDCQPKAMLLYGAEYETDLTKIDLKEAEAWAGNIQNPEKVNKAEDLIYCIYTSGTTGTPKGVLLEHHGVTNLATYMRTELHIKSEDHIMLFANYVFDGSVWEILMAHMNGATLCVPTDETIRDPANMKVYVTDHKINISYFPPAYYEQGKFELDGYVVTAGSQSNSSLVKQITEYSKYINSYGPTEVTICASNWICGMNAEVPENIPIGKPISNTQIYILNGDNLCGIGVPGELCIAGDGLARGYLNRPELTEEKFVKNPFGEGRMYRSGDLARWLPDGNIEYLGRIDEQVKIRGFRIELGEIDSRIREIEGIHNCAVIAKADRNGDQAIYAYYTGESVSVSGIRDQLAGVLPEYMIPSYMLEIDSIPVTRNGKLDKKALPEIEVKATREYVAPSNETEETICKIFGEILDVENVGVKDSFFELGGHSLRATRLVNRIESETGYRIALKDVFSNPTSEKLSQIVLESETEEYISIPRAEEKEYYAMSSAQKRTYLIQQMDPEGTMYNVPQALKLTGEVNVEVLRRAIQEIVERHEVLRTEFLMVNGEAVQKVLEIAEVLFEYEEASNRTDEEEMKLFVRAFDLSKAPQIRTRFVQRDTYGLLMLDMHHIVGDGMSIATFMNELNTLYKGENLEPLSHQFKDYSEWMSSRNLESQRAYWLSQFEDEIPVLDMPLDYARPQEQSYEGSITGSILDKELAKKIKALAKRTGTTEYMVFLSAAMVLLGKYSRQEDIVIGSPISGRTHRDTEEMLGMFLNTLAMRGRPEKKKRFEDFLLEMKEVCLKAYENQEYPFEELVEESQVQRDLSRNPLFDVMLVLQNNETAELGLEGTEAEGAGLVSTVAKFDLTFNMAEYEGQYGVMLEYCTALFKEETVKRMLKHYEEILRQVVEQQDCLLGQVEMVTENEKQMVLHDFNTTKVAYPREMMVVELFEEQVAKTPDKIALIFEGEEVSYRELNERANMLAHKLKELGVRPDDFVAIKAERSIEMITGIYGIIKSGAAYVPIDPMYPEERIEFMLEDCQPKAMLLYGAEYETDLTKIDLKEARTWEGNTQNPEKVNKAEDLICCLYTSGTTGTPKGVMIKHQGIRNLIGWLQNEYPLDENDVILQKTTFVFDVSASEIFWWSTVGAKLAILKKEAEKDPAEIAMEINRYGVTVVNFVPSMLVAFLRIPMQYTEKLKSLKYVLAAGEALNVDIVKDFYEVVSKHEINALLGNIYGPTEAVYVTFFNCTKEFDVMSVPIGKPISNTQIYILNGDNLCGIGVPGELCIAGDGLARGYLNRPELTEEKFVKNPFGEGRMYRSGDLARWLPDGNIEYLGRIDEQVKIRGFRIELGEIESRIREIKGIHASVVIAKADQTGDQALYAYYTGESVSVAEIRNRLADVLPDYMIPAYMMEIDSIPVTRNGKLDKKALPVIEVKATQEYLAPSNEKERMLCESFCKILNIKQVGIKDSFFELGGDSIKAIRIIAELRNKGHVLAVTEILRGKTVEKIAERMMLSEEIINPEYEVKIVRQMNSIDKASENQVGEAILLDIIKKYNDNIVDAEVEDSYKVTPMQRIYYAYEFPQVCKVIIELGQGFSKEEIQNAVKKVVSEQSVLRCVYNNVTQKINEFEYDDNWEIPYLEEDSHESILEYDITLKKGASFFKVDGNLSLIMQVKKTNGGHYVMLYIHHGVYDEFSGLIFRDRLEHYLQKNEMVEKQKYSEYAKNCVDTNVNELYSEQFINSYQESLQDLTSFIKKKNKKNLWQWGKKENQKSYSARIEWRMEKELVDKFNEEPIENFMRLVIEMNPMFAEKEVLPFSLLHHGRTQVDDILMGLHLDLLPGLYEVENNQITGGHELVKGDNGGSGPVFDEKLYDLCMNKENAFLVLNYGGIFDGDYEMADSTKESIVKVSDIQSGESKCGIIDDVLLFSSPIQSDTKENALSKAEEGLERFKNWLKEKSYISIEV